LVWLKFGLVEDDEHSYLVWGVRPVRDRLLFQMALNHEQLEWVPRLTEAGFQKVPVPRGLWRSLSRDYQRVRPRMVQESCIQSVINCQEVQVEAGESFLRNVQRTYMMELAAEVLEEVREVLRPLAEAWSGVLLEHTSTYGVRRYTNHSWLVAHLDRLGTHVVSTIINLGQEVEEDWVLYIKDHQGNTHQVVLAPGEMVWYESARLVHGRMQHMRGSYYDNMFLHYRPRGLWYTGQYQIGVRPWHGAPLTVEQIRKSQENMKP